MSRSDRPIISSANSKSDINIIMIQETCAGGRGRPKEAWIMECPSKAIKKAQLIRCYISHNHSIEIFF